MGQPEFAAALREEMQRTGHNQSSLAREASGVSQQTIGKWLLGDVQDPSPRMVYEVERVLGLPAGHLSQHLGFVPTGTRQSEVLQFIAVERANLEREREAVRAERASLLAERARLLGEVDDELDRREGTEAPNDPSAA